MSKTILLGWEYGGGFGHAAMLTPLARALKARGYRPVLCLRQVEATRPVWEHAGVEVVQCPVMPFPKPWDSAAATDTLADVLALCGCNAAQYLLPLAAKWNALLKEVKPDLVVCEMAPTLAMTTIARIPTMTIGTGYSVPPKHMITPSARFWDDKALSGQSLLNEQTILHEINLVREALGLHRFAYFSDLFNGDAQHVCILPQLDCYARYRDTPAIGPLVVQPIQPPVPEAATPHRLFAYLSADSGIEHLRWMVREIKKTGMACDAYLRGVSDEVVRTMETEHFKVVKAMQPFAQILPARACFIHHGGISTTDLGLRIGIPQLLLPQHLEQKTTSVAALRMGAAKVIYTHEFGAPDLARGAIGQLVTVPSYRAQAQALAHSLAAPRLPSALERVVADCERRLERGEETRVNFS